MRSLMWCQPPENHEHSIWKEAWGLEKDRTDPATFFSLSITKSSLSKHSQSRISWFGILLYSIEKLTSTWARTILSKFTVFIKLKPEQF